MSDMPDRPQDGPSVYKCAVDLGPAANSFIDGTKIKRPLDTLDYIEAASGIRLHIAHCDMSFSVDGDGRPTIHIKGLANAN